MVNLSLLFSRPRVNCVSCFMEVSPENPVEGTFKLLICERITEWINWAVGIAEEVREIKEMAIHATACISAEAFDKGADMIWCPTYDECTQNEGDCSQSFARAVLRF